MIGMLLNVAYRRVHKNISTKESDGLHNHSTLLTLVGLSLKQNFNSRMKFEELGNLMD